MRKFTINRKIIEHSYSVHYYVRRTWICLYICVYKFLKIMSHIKTYLDHYNSEIDKSKNF